MSTLPKRNIDLSSFRKDFSYYYNYSISKIANIHLENFNFRHKNEKLILEDILVKILEHQNFKLKSLYMNFYYGNLAEFIGKIVSIDNLSLTENSLKLNGLECLQPFNKIKKIYVDPSITKEKSLICKLMNENCNFDKKLNIFSNSEYLDYSIFSNLEKITINFSSKKVTMFNVSLSGKKLIELFIEDINEDYKMSPSEKNQFNFNFEENIDSENINPNNMLNSSFTDKNKLRSNSNSSLGNTSLNRVNSAYDSGRNINPNSTGSDFGTNSFKINKSRLKQKTKDMDIKNTAHINSKSQTFELFKNKSLSFNKSNYSQNNSPIKRNSSHINRPESNNNFSIGNMNNKKNNDFFDVLNQNINIHEKFNSFGNLKTLKFTNCLLNSKLKISHCRNLKELIFDDCLFNKPPYEYFMSIEKLSFKDCFQKISLEELNMIANKFKNLICLSLHNPTDQFFETVILSNILLNLKTLELCRIFYENMDELFKILLKIKSFEKLIFFPDYKRFTNMLLLIKLLEFMLRLNSHIEHLEFLVGISFTAANVDRVKYFLRKLKYLKYIKLYVHPTQEKLWKDHFKDFNVLGFEIGTETPDNDIMSYFINE